MLLVAGSVRILHFVLSLCAECQSRQSCRVNHFTPYLHLLRHIVQILFDHWRKHARRENRLQIFLLLLFCDFLPAALAHDSIGSFHCLFEQAAKFLRNCLCIYQLCLRRLQKFHSLRTAFAEKCSVAQCVQFACDRRSRQPLNISPPVSL